MSGRFDSLLPCYNTYSDGSPEQEAANSAYIRYRHVMGGYVEATPEEIAEALKGDTEKQDHREDY
jgi:hypothetical protein